MLFDLLAVEAGYWRIIAHDLTQCLALCPANLQWKVYLILGRFAAVEGYPHIARSVIGRSW